MKKLIGFMCLMLTLTSIGFSQRYIFNNYRANGKEVYLQVGSGIDTAIVGLRLINGDDTLSITNHIGVVGDRDTDTNRIFFGKIGYQVSSKQGLLFGTVTLDTNSPNYNSQSFIAMMRGTTMVNGNIMMGSAIDLMEHKTGALLIVNKDLGVGIMVGYGADTGTAFQITKTGINEGVYRHNGYFRYTRNINSTYFSSRYDHFTTYIDTVQANEQYGYYLTDGLYNRKINNHSLRIDFHDNEYMADSTSHSFSVNKDEILKIKHDSITAMSALTITPALIQSKSNVVVDISRSAFKPQIYSQGTEPNIPNDSQAYWYDNTLEATKMYLVIDRIGTQYKIELTPSTP